MLFYNILCTLPVAPFAGAWIEMLLFDTYALLDIVAPFAGAWIEIKGKPNGSALETVAPFAGAWIEIKFFHFAFGVSVSLPSRERGLKSYCLSPAP